MNTAEALLNVIGDLKITLTNTQEERDRAYVEIDQLVARLHALETPSDIETEAAHG